MRGSDKHSARQDDALAGEVEGMMRSGHSTHAQEWKDPEPSGEDQPGVDVAPNGELVGGTAFGMTPADVEGRSAIAVVLGRTPFPGDREAILEVALANDASAAILSQLEQLPEGRTFVNVEDVWETLGGGREDPDHRA